eukprot:TRINITY_DN2727_c0_g1_i1.p1 TRINITY_DN2727_c0_g1~~TRINITY_DN2727_c0_g1_i1.p1  ORF type:complete len:227 (-),score=65.13 TRINITY_DN2727_c0_g1_i1:123-803(-)
MGNQSSQLTNQDFQKYKTHLSQEQIQKLYDEWKDTSKNSGEIDKKKFGEMIAKLGLLDNVPKLAQEKDLPPSVIRSALIDEMFLLFDEDQSGKITFDEFISGVSIMMYGTETEQYEAIFRWRDKNGDGRLDRTELYESIKYTMRAAKKMIDSSMPYLKKTKGPEGANKVKALLDSWNDEKNLQSFVDQIFAVADTDKNGSISFDEFKVYVENNPAWLDVFKQTRKQ